MRPPAIKAPATPLAAWVMLAAALLAQATSSIVVNGLPFVLPQIQAQDSLSLPIAGLVVSAPLAGTMVALVAWGAVIDRIGERLSLCLSLGTTAVALAGAALSGPVLAVAIWMFFAGLASAATGSAGGRIVVGWFPVHRRGLAMGIRQMAQPLGVGIASLALPALAHGAVASFSRWQVSLAAVAVLAAVVALLVRLCIKNPARRARKEDVRAENPYRRDAYLLRIHVVSALLVVPQFTVWTFSLVWLINEMHVSPLAAGVIIAVTQLLGALGRIASGVLSDRLHSRVKPLRAIAIAAAVAMIALAASDWLGRTGSVTVLAIGLLVVTSIITVADNGLAFTSVAEVAGPYFSGRALGLQNTGQFVVSALVPPVIGGLITVAGFPISFALVGLLPLVAAPLVPSSDAERRAAAAAS